LFSDAPSYRALCIGWSSIRKYTELWNLPLNASTLTCHYAGSIIAPMPVRQNTFQKAWLNNSVIAGHDSEDEDIAAQLGVGSLAADVELDTLKDAAEGEIVGMKSLLGRYAPLLAALCHNR